jgi:hypothetical protein
MVVQRLSMWTEESYLAFERASDVRHEFLHGETFVIAGASLRHNRITSVANP